jgi:formate/nitrite transporter FocA (FNT family)
MPSGRVSELQPSYDRLTWGSFFCNNLLPVTIGNMIGGVIFVALVYWVTYLRNKQTFSN